jgi:hypothetical protein
MHKTCHELRGRYSIESIAEMSWEDNWKTVANEVSREAISVVLVRCDVLKCLAIIRVAEEYDGGDLGGSSRRNLFHA